MTRDELITEIAWEGKIKGDTEALARIPSLILDAAIFIGQTHPELLLIDSVEYDLATENPTPFVNALAIERVEIGGIDNIRDAVTLPEEGKLVGPAPYPGWPKCYAIEGNASIAASSPKGISIRLYGGGSLDAGVDFFIVYYKKVPQLINGTNIIPDSWINILKKEVLSRLALQKNQIELGKAYAGGVVQASQIQVRSDQESTASTN